MIRVHGPTGKQRSRGGIASLDSGAPHGHHDGMKKGRKLRPSDSTVPLGDYRPAPVEAEPELPEEIGGLRILEILGTGGMGEVFLAYDETLSRKIALKRVRADRIGEQEIRQRFEIEARVTAMLQHPSIIPVYHYVAGAEGTYYTMRPVEGMSLSELLKRLRESHPGVHEEWPTVRIVRLFLQAANAIAFAHSRGVIHRDLKPANIMIGPFEEVLVLDWGMAKVIGRDAEEPHPSIPLDPLRELTELTASHALVGTPSYMAPEQFRNEPATFESDIFSLGVILYELLALRAPWVAETILELREAMKKSPELPTRLQPGRGIPSRLAEVAMRALERDPARRFRSVGDFANAVAHTLEGRATWEIARPASDASGWRMADGRVRDENGELLIRSRGRRQTFRYFCTERFTDNVRIQFDFSIRRGKHELSVWLNASNPRRDTSETGYCLSVLSGRRRTLSLLRSGRDVAGAKSPEYEPKRWYSATVTRLDDHFSLRVDDEEVYVHSDPIPLTGGFVGLTGRSNGLQIRNLRVYSRGTSATVSCLAVPDALFNRRHYEEARSEYNRIAASHPGRDEGRLAAFRGGMCLLEMARQEEAPDVRQMLIEEAGNAFAEIPAVNDSCLAALGRAMVAGERGRSAEKHEILSRALQGYPGDPHLSAVREWMLGRLHSLDAAQRQPVAELMPLAITHCMADWGAGVVLDLMKDVRSEWEIPSFFTGRSRFREADPVSHAEARLFFGFWTARPKLIERTTIGLLQKDLLRPHHLADAALALLELGLHERAAELLKGLERAMKVPRGDKVQAIWTLCRTAILAAAGEIGEAGALFAKMELSPSDRASNSVRLCLARAEFDAGEHAKALKTLQRVDRQDNFAREHQAWFCLLLGDTNRADRELEPFIKRNDHRDGRNLTNLLHGASLLMKEREDEAMAVFGYLDPSPWPRTWTLGSLVGAGHLNGHALERYLSGSFLWERKHLYSQMAMLAHARSDEEEKLRCTEQAKAQVAH